LMTLFDLKLRKIILVKKVHIVNVLSMQE
jgi:hypothetical protein